MKRQQREDDLRKLKANDATLKVVRWHKSGLEDAEVLKLAGVLRGNKACQWVKLHDNSDVTDHSMVELRDAVGNSGVMGVTLDDTAVSEREQSAMRKICASNARRRLKANDTEVIAVNWYKCGVGDAEVQALAQGLQGNSVCQAVMLPQNLDVTDSSVGVLQRAVEESGVIGVALDGTSVSSAQQSAMRGVFASKASRRLKENDAEIEQIDWCVKLCCPAVPLQLPPPPRLWPMSSTDSETEGPLRTHACIHGN